jgi:lipoate-protein ligase A
MLPYEVADGPANMALDVALLDAVDASPDRAVLRFYGWGEPTLSLGYFQPYARAVEDPRWHGVPIVRRPSGGGAIWHDGDLTYAIIAPRSHPAASRPQALYRAVHTALIEVLRDAEMPASRRGDGAGAAASPKSPFLCFLDADPEDVVVGGHKVIGGAQRRRPRAVLQHGSIALRTSDRTPELRGLDRLGLEGAADAAGWSGRWGRRLGVALGFDPRADDVSPAERSSARALAASTFATDAWNRRR